MLYRLLFCLRRAIFIFSIYQLYNYITLQICLFYYSNLFISIFQGQFSPLKGKLQNRLQLMNEIFVCFIAYFSMLFTDYVSTDYDKYTFGWVQIAMISTSFVINILIVILLSYREVRMIYLKCYYYIHIKGQKLWDYIKIKLWPQV